jgi:putative DNA primase/helicase
MKTISLTRRSADGQIQAGSEASAIKIGIAQQLRPLGLNDFLALEVPPREMLLAPIIPERSLSMVYAPRGLGKSWFALSIGVAVASGASFLRWQAPKPRRVLLVDGEMPLCDLTKRLAALSVGRGLMVANENFRILAADASETGIDIGSSEGQSALEPHLKDVDLLILDNLSTLTATGSESVGDAWLPLQNWLLKLRRKGVAVLLVHHAGVNGRQRGTSRREDALDTVIALRHPADYVPIQGARFEVRLEKLRGVAGAAQPFEAAIDLLSPDCGPNCIRWATSDVEPPLMQQAADLFRGGLSVREVAGILGISRSEAGRQRKKADDCRDLLGQWHSVTHYGLYVRRWVAFGRRANGRVVRYLLFCVGGRRFCLPDSERDISSRNPRSGHCMLLRARHGHWRKRFAPLNWLAD